MYCGCAFETAEKSFILSNGLGWLTGKGRVVSQGDTPSSEPKYPNKQYAVCQTIFFYSGLFLFLEKCLAFKKRVLEPTGISPQNYQQFTAFYAKNKETFVGAYGFLKKQTWISIFKTRRGSASQKPNIFISFAPCYICPRISTI
jgi:hypothetical protein